MRIRFALLLLLAACGSVQSDPADGAPPVSDGAPPVGDGAPPVSDAAIAAGGPEMDVQTVVAGAGRLTGGTLTLDVAVGQPVLPTASGGTVTLGGATP